MRPGESMDGARARRRGESEGSGGDGLSIRGTARGRARAVAWRRGCNRFRREPSEEAKALSEFSGLLALRPDRERIDAAPPTAVKLGDEAGIAVGKRVAFAS